MEAPLHPKVRLFKALITVRFRQMARCGPRSRSRLHRIRDVTGRRAYDLRLNETVPCACLIRPQARPMSGTGPQLAAAPAVVPPSEPATRPHGAEKRAKFHALAPSAFMFISGVLAAGAPLTKRRLQCSLSC